MIVAAIMGLPPSSRSTISPDLGGRVWVGLRWGMMAGTLYGIGTLLGGLTSEASGMWSVVANRFSSLIVAVIVAVRPAAGAVVSSAAWRC